MNSIIRQCFFIAGIMIWLCLNTNLYSNSSQTQAMESFDEWWATGDPGEDKILQGDEDTENHFYFNYSRDTVIVTFTIQNDGNCNVIIMDNIGENEQARATIGTGKPIRVRVKLRGAKKPDFASLSAKCEDHSDKICDYKITNVEP
jgi:hypothetical protein